VLVFEERVGGAESDASSQRELLGDDVARKE
jgi:hypothetical protein